MGLGTALEQGVNLHMPSLLGPVPNSDGRKFMF